MRELLTIPAQTPRTEVTFSEYEALQAGQQLVLAITQDGVRSTARLTAEQVRTLGAFCTAWWWTHAE